MQLFKRKVSNSKIMHYLCIRKVIICTVWTCPIDLLCKKQDRIRLHACCRKS